MPELSLMAGVLVGFTAAISLLGVSSLFTARGAARRRIVRR